MRNPTYTNEDIIAAGKALQEKELPVNAFSLRKKLGGGNALRLMQVWNEYVAMHTAKDAAPIVELPVEVAERFNEIKTLFVEQLSTLVIDMNTRAVNASERRVTEVVRTAGEQREQAERALVDAAEAVDELELQLDTANDTIAQIRSQLERVIGEKQGLTVELAQVKERLTSVEKSAEVAQEAATARERDLREQLVEQRQLEQMAREREAQAVGAQAALEKQHLEDAEVSTRLRLEVASVRDELAKAIAKTEAQGAQLEQQAQSLKDSQQALKDAQTEAKAALKQSAEATGREQSALAQVKNLTEEVRQLAAGKAAKPASGKAAKAAAGKDGQGDKT